MSASIALKSLDYKGRSVHATLELVTHSNIGERLVLTFERDSDHELTPVVLMPEDAQALAHALLMFS